jgi:replicative DNA helicase
VTDASVFTDHQPPYAEEAEMSTLGCALISTNAADALPEALTASDFYNPAHQKVYGAILGLRMADKPVDTFSVPEELRRRQQLEQCGGIAYINALENSPATAANFGYYAGIVREKSILRRLIAAGREIIAEAYEGVVPAEGQIMHAEAHLQSAAGPALQEEFISTRELAGPFYESLFQPPVTGIKTGFQALDHRLLSGFMKTHLYVFGGRPSTGKTALLCNFALHAGEQGVPVAFFSLEQSRGQIARRLVSIHSEVPMDRIQRGQLTDREREELVSAIGAVGDMPIFIDDVREPTLLALRGRARRARRRHAVGLVLVDYLQLVLPDGRGESDVRHFTAVAEGLKSMARELDVPVVALSQLSRNVERRDVQKPTLADIRESGGIEQAADVVGLLYNANYYLRLKGDAVPPPDVVEINCPKIRDGAPGLVKLVFHGPCLKFRDADERHEEPPSREDLMR